MKRERGYTCDACKIVLVAPSVHKFLHVTYTEEAKRKPDTKNVKVLCLRCHADQPKHAAMKSLLEYREFVRRFGEAPSPAKPANPVKPAIPVLRAARES